MGQLTGYDNDVWAVQELADPRRFVGRFDLRPLGMLPGLAPSVLAVFLPLATADVVYSNLGPGDMVAISGRILSGPDHDAFGNINR